MGYQFFDGFFIINKCEKMIFINVYSVCKSLFVINVGSPYGLHGVPNYILYLYDQMWLVGNTNQHHNNRKEVHSIKITK